MPIGNGIVSVLQDLGSGAMPTLHQGVIDATDQINAALANAKANRKMVWFAPGTYRCDGVISVSAWDAVSIRGNGAKLLSHSSKTLNGGAMMALSNCSCLDGGIGIQELLLDGNRGNRTGTMQDGAASAGLDLDNCTDLWVSYCEVSRHGGAGINLRGTGNGCERVQVGHCKLFDNAAMGMRVTSARDCQVIGGYIRDHHKRAPACGVLLTPDSTLEVSGFLVVGTHFSDNHGGDLTEILGTGTIRGISFHAFQSRLSGGQQTDDADLASHSVFKLVGESNLIHGGQIFDIGGVTNLASIIEINGTAQQVADILFNNLPAITVIDIPASSSNIHIADVRFEMIGVNAKAIMSAAPQTSVVGAHVNATNATQAFPIDLTGVDSVLDGYVVRNNSASKVRNNGANSVTGDGYP